MVFFHKLVVEQKRCDVKGFTLCRIDHDIRKTLTTLYDLQRSSQAVADFESRRDGYTSEIMRLVAEQQISAADAEALLMQLASDLETPKLSLHDSFGIIDQEMRNSNDTYEKLLTQMDDTFNNVSSIISDHSHLIDGKELKEKMGMLNEAATAGETSFNDKTFAVRLSYADVEERMTESDAQLLNHLSESKNKISQSEKETAELVSKLGREEEIEKLHQHSINLVNQVDAEINGSSDERSQLEEWAQTAGEDSQKLVTMIRNLTDNLPSDLLAELDPTLLVNNSLSSYEAHAGVNMSFQTTSYILLSLLTILVIANTILIWKWKDEEGPTFERMDEGL